MAIGWAVAALVMLAILVIVCRIVGPTKDRAEGGTEGTVPLSPAETAGTVPLSLEEKQVSAISGDAILLAKIMQLETRPGWPDWAVMCVGEVVLNRVASPLFPDTIREVIYQTGPVQYAPVYAGGWDTLEPGQEYIDLALQLLAGERAMNDPDVVWQALFPQGTVTVATYHDRVLGNTTYFCA